MTVMIQASPKDALGNLYNIKSEADEPEVAWADFGAVLVSIGGVELAETVRQHLLTALNAAAPDLTPRAVQAVQAAIPAQVISQPEPWGNPPVPPMQQPQLPAAAAQPAAPPAPVCQHGQKQYKSGVSAKGPWAFWGCPARQDDPSRCDKEWIR